jgi:Winged helix DNA-binding domain
MTAMNTRKSLDLTRQQILSHRRQANGLVSRLSPGAASVRRAALVGLQDSMPRAAVLSLHARVQGTKPEAWADSSVVQLWGPRFSAYTVAIEDRAIFSLGRLPPGGAQRRRAEDLANRLQHWLDGREMPYSEAGRGMGVAPNLLRYAAATGTVLIRWDGADRPTVRTVPRPSVDPAQAQLELARRHLYVFGPSTAEGFATWAGISKVAARAAHQALAPTLIPVRTPVGHAWILAEQEAGFRAIAGAVEGVRLLPSGDAYFLLQGADRELLVPEADRRAALWTSRVWPGAIMLNGELVGTWRRAGREVMVQPWGRMSSAIRDAVTAEAESLPLPGTANSTRVHWVT